MPLAPATTRLFVGIDIAARSFTASSLKPENDPSKPKTYDQSPTGYAAFIKALHATRFKPAQILIALEATSSYWVALAVTLHDAGYLLCVVNPANVHHHAQSDGRRNKTDALDAQLLADYAHSKRRHLQLWSPPPQIYHELRQRLVARDALMEMRVQTTNQMHALAQWPVQVASVREHLQRVVTTLDGQLKQLEGEIKEVLQNGAWAESAAHLMSITGIGLITACWLLVGTVNFTTCKSAQSAAHYAGLVPMKKESGTSVRGRPSIGHGGNGRVRTALYMATMSAVQHNVVLKEFYERLRGAGKPAKVARIAAARKLMHIAFAVVRKGQDFSPSYQKLSSSV
jgi:transposase